MSIRTIIEPSAEYLDKLSVRQLRQSNSADLADGTKYAVVLLKLHPTVIQDDYPALKVSIEEIAGIQSASLLIDHQTRASVPVNHTQVLGVRANVELREDK